MFISLCARYLSVKDHDAQLECFRLKIQVQCIIIITTNKRKPSSPNPDQTPTRDAFKYCVSPSTRVPTLGCLRVITEPYAYLHMLWTYH